MTQPIRFAAIQIAAADVEQHRETLAHSLELIDRAAAKGAKLIALPECTYPGYFLRSAETPAKLGVLSGGEAVQRYADKAAQRGVHLAVGLAYLEEDGTISNSAVLIDPSGNEIGRYSKSLLWHFDNEWFRCGTEYPVFETQLGRIGLFICADGRQPEITRTICLGRPDLVVDLTAWVSWGRDRATLSSSQPDRLLPARAMENGVWIAAAGKIGEESGSILYCGSSCLVSPSGEVVQRASSDREEVAVWEVPIEQPATALIERRPELYEMLIRPTESLPVVRRMRERARADRSLMVSATQVPAYRDRQELFTVARKVVQDGRAQGVDLFVLPACDPAHPSEFDINGVESEIAALLEGDEILVVALSEPAEDGYYRTAFALTKAGVLGRHRQTHLGVHALPAGARRGEQTSPIIEMPWGTLGLLAGAEGFVPEVARCLMLEGADVIVWSAFEPPFPVSTFAQTRAEENRVFVVAASALSPNGGAVVAEPSGFISASAPLDRPLTVSALINPAWARWKERAPGTDVVLSRQPETYGQLTALAMPAPG
ncbi:MAG TPA: carbon-nitrogen hydrolase family protein [Dehalococcoidia bacterium]|nr:carbon-nitrogen hydrolase family protein [Dehalococcoidia bacterium]